MEQMKMLLREAMEQGSLGLSSGLIYAPGCYADREELTELCRVVAEYGGIYTSHMRNESDDVVNGVKEALTIGREAGVPVFISHHKICGVPNWGKSVETLKLVEEARQAGQQVTLDQYPYLASMTNMSAVVPPDHFGEGAAALARRLGERGKGDGLWRKIAGEIENRQDFENQYRNCGGWEHILISSLPETKEYEGMTVAEAARTVSELVEKDGLTSKMVDCHELRQGDELRGMVLIFEKYFIRAGSRLTMTAVLDSLEGRTRLYWAVTGGEGILGQSGDSKAAAEKYSESLRQKLFPYLALD